MGCCVQSVQSVHTLRGGRRQGAPRQLGAGPGRGECSQSKCIWPCLSYSVSYEQLRAGCMISARAEPGTAQVEAGKEP